MFVNSSNEFYNLWSKIVIGSSFCYFNLPICGADVECTRILNNPDTSPKPVSFILFPIYLIAIPFALFFCLKILSSMFLFLSHSASNLIVNLIGFTFKIHPYYYHFFPTSPLHLALSYHCCSPPKLVALFLHLQPVIILNTFLIIIF